MSDFGWQMRLTGWSDEPPVPGELWYVEEAFRHSDEITYYFVISCYPFCRLADKELKLWEPTYEITLMWSENKKGRPTIHTFIYSVKEWHTALLRKETC